MKASVIGIACILLLTACSSMRDRDDGSGMGAGYGASGTYNNTEATGIGSSSTGQPYGAPNTGIPPTTGTGIPGGGPR